MEENLNESIIENLNKDYKMEALVVRDDRRVEIIYYRIINNNGEIGYERR